eukprot:535713_1
MGVHHAHLVPEALGHAGKHVGDVRRDGADHRLRLGVGEPQLGLDLPAAGHEAQVELRVRERALERAALADHGDLAAVQRDLDALGHVNDLGVEDGARHGGG